MQPGPGPLALVGSGEYLAVMAGVEGALIDLAYAKGFPLVATNEPYFATADDYEAHDALLCIAGGRLIAETDRHSDLARVGGYVQQRQAAIEPLPGNVRVMGMAVNMSAPHYAS